MLRKMLIILLLFNAVSGIVGGVGLAVYPDGRVLGLPTAWLADTPFPNYLIPGVTLLIVNGLLPILVVKQVWQRGKYAARWLWLQGILSMG